jgi:Mce-associated membrane protein
VAVAAHSTDRPLTRDARGEDHDLDRADDAVGPAPAAPAAAGGTPRWVRPTGMVLLVLLVAALVGAIHFGIAAASGFLTQQDREDVVDAARATTVALTSFDGETADEGVQRLLETTTSNYQASFSGDKEAFIRQMAANKVKMTGTVTEAGLTSYDAEKGTASVILAVSTQQGLPTGGQQNVDYRMQLQMEKVDGDWLTARTDFLS